MRRAIPGILAIVVTGAVAVPATAQADNQTVGLTAAHTFSPSRVAVKQGESVTWTNADDHDAHNVRFEDGSFTQPSPPTITFATPVKRTFATPGVYAYYCEIHGSPGGVGMAGIVYVNASGELPPVARFTASPSTSVVGQTVTFDASPSTASNSTIATYEWDLDGNGTYERNTLTTPTTSQSYPAVQEVVVGLKVTDSRGATDERTLRVTVEPVPPPTADPAPAPAPALAPAPVAQPAPATAPAPVPPLTPPAIAAVQRDVLAPGVSAYRMASRSFLVGTRPKRRAGTTFRYVLSEDGRAKIVIAQQRGAKRVMGTLTRNSRRGANSIAFSGRIGGRALRPGRYKATLTVADTAGNRSRAKTVTFTVVRR